TVDLDSVTEANGTYTATMTVRRAGPSEGNNDWAWSSALWQKLELHDAKGNKYYTTGPNSHNGGQGGVATLSVSFTPDDRRGRGATGPKPGPPTKLVLNEWVVVNH